LQFSRQIKRAMRKKKAVAKKAAEASAVQMAADASVAQKAVEAAAAKVSA
jgi:hypothetical protein